MARGGGGLLPQLLRPPPGYLEALPEAERAGHLNFLSGMRRYSEMPLKILKAEGWWGARRLWMRSCTVLQPGAGSYVPLSDVRNF